MKLTTKKIVFSSLFAAIVCVATFVVRIPSALTGYIHMGDAAVLLSAYILGPLGGAMASGIGSFLADMFSGYMVYAPWTFIVKFLVALTAGFLFYKQKGKPLSIVISGILGESIMIFGYVIADFFITKSIEVALLGIYGSMIQAAFGIIVSTAFYKLF